ncbi:MAG: PAS domain-containing sensor histidine kinase [Fimbriimonadaceae bacterium]|nr:PAS domain-containing sensor histidine kinase [Fimbriimonadaceae bacterium]
MTAASCPLLTQPWLDELLWASSAGIALLDPAGRIVRHNDPLAALCERPPGELDGALLAELFDDATWTLALQAARGRGWWTGRVRRGEREIDARLRYGPDGRGVLVLQDVSESVALGRRAQVLAAQLEQHVSVADEARELLFEQSERLTSVYQLTLGALESASLRDSAGRLCESLLSDLGGENAAIWLLDQNQDLLRRVGAVGRRAKALPITVSTASAPQALAALGGGLTAPAAESGALRGFAVFVLPGKGQPLGLVGIDHAPDLDQAQLYMPHVATAINNAILAEELARANVQLRQIDQQKSEFLNIVAHDLRTPLTCIRTYADLLTMYADEPPETHQEFLRIIIEETTRLGELLDNFLDLARIENASIRYEPEPVRLDELAQHFAQVYHGRSVAEQVELRVEAPELPPITADRRRIEQVFSNLLSNAFKFTPAAGCVELVVAAAAEGATLVVSDTGPGVPARERQRIFERFRQAPGSHARGGSGLGLAIAQAVVTHHGGRIAVDDAPGGGARFSVWLPTEPPADSVVGRALP